MSLRETIGETFRSIKKEYAKTELSDKILDIIALSGAVLFLVAFFSVFLSSKFNSVNIAFMLYPLGVAGVASAFRMKKRDRPEENENLLKNWLWIVGPLTAIFVLVIILGFVFV